MWITTKSIVKEIKKNQEELAVKLDLLATEQKENSSTLRNQLDSISERLEYLEKTCMDESENGRNQLAVLVKGLEELKYFIGEVQDKICNVVAKQTQTYSSCVSTSVSKGTETLLGQISISTDKICGTVETLTDNYEHALLEEIQSVKEKSDTDREKCITILMDTIREKIEQLEKELSEKSNEIVLETKKSSNNIAGEINSIGGIIQSVSSAAASRDAAMSDNIEIMNHAMQEMMRNLLSLDEGNRLIIAKLLLKDMEI